MGLSENALNVTDTVVADSANFGTPQLIPQSTAPSVQGVDSYELCFYDGSSWTGLKIGGVCS